MDINVDDYRKNKHRQNTNDGLRDELIRFDIVDSVDRNKTFVFVMVASVCILN